MSTLTPAFSQRESEQFSGLVPSRHLQFSELRLSRHLHSSLSPWERAGVRATAAESNE